MTRPPGPAGKATPSATMPPSGPWPQYPKDPHGWPSNQPDTYSSYASGTGTGEWYDSSAAMPWSQSNQPTFTNQSSGSFTAPTPQFPANPTMASGYQQQSSLPVSGQTAPIVSQSGNVMAPIQQGLDTGGAYGWNNDAWNTDATAGQWPTQSQWPWPQDNNQWQQSQPFPYMVRFVMLCICSYVSILEIATYFLCFVTFVMPSRSGLHGCSTKYLLDIGCIY